MELEHFYQENVDSFNEKPIVQTDGARFIPDRLVFSDSKVAILDYKTGKASTSHERQIENYALILTRMGYDVTHKILVYIDDDITLKSLS